jgi:hypothetical protein
MPPEPCHAATQAAFHAALWQADPPAGLTAPRPDEVARRFAVYRNNVRHGLTRALAARFPVVEALVGTDFFAAMARVFIAGAPPSDPVLLGWGAELPAFLDRFPPVAHLPWLGDVARLEMARGRAYHAADATPASPEALGLPDPSPLRLVLHPSVTLFASRYPAVAIWQAHQPGADRRPLPPGPEHALIGRAPDLTVAVQPVDAATHAVLRALAGGATLGQAAGIADPAPALTLLLRHGLITDIRSGDLP